MEKGPTLKLRSLTTTLLRYRHVPLLMGLLTGLAIGCAGGEEQPCDDLCHDAGYDDNADEHGHMDGSLECICGGLGVGIPEDACAEYCESNDYDGDKATVTGDACLCEP